MKNEIRTTKNEMNLADNLRVEHRTHEIIITKRMEAACRKYGSEAYNKLKAVRADNPDFAVVVRTMAKSKTRLKLNYDFMMAYIQKHDDEENTAMTKFKEMIAYEAKQQKLKKQDGNLIKVAAYKDVRKWFLERFPEVKDYIENTKKAA